MWGTSGCEDRKAKTSGDETPLSQSWEKRRANCSFVFVPEFESIALVTPVVADDQNSVSFSKQDTDPDARRSIVYQVVEA